ncbi:MAG: cyclase family protein [Saprospiraceae bacterium]|nr:cyclase family protein [Saprospiraceae bacterium]
MRNLIIAGIILQLLSCDSRIIQLDLGAGQWIDLTHTFGDQTIYWPTSDPFLLDTVSEGITDAGYYYSAFSFCTAEHGGTHMDAPVHFAAGMQAMDEVPIDRLIGEAVVLDVSLAALLDPDYQISIEDFVQWEDVHGQIPNQAIVLIHTGYAKFWPDPVKYMGTAEKGAEAVAKLHFPGLDPIAARWLVEERTIKAIGLDTPSIDYGQSQLFETHRILFAENIPAFENVANLDQVPSLGSWVIALPMKIAGGSGGPLRIVAWTPPDS